MGVIANPVSEKNGKLIGIAAVKGDETIVFLTTAGLMIRTRVDEIPTHGRTAAGVKFLTLPEDVTLATFSLAPAEDEDEPAPEGTTEPAAEGSEEAPAEPAPEANPDGDSAPTDGQDA